MKKVNLPLLERFKRFYCDLLGKPFIWFSFKYLPDVDLSEVVFDFNQAMIVQLSQMGYDVSDPENAVVEYISNCAAASLEENEE